MSSGNDDTKERQLNRSPAVFNSRVDKLCDGDGAEKVCIVSRAKVRVHKFMA